MEFTVSSATLLKGIMDVAKAIPVKTALPILENFLFRSEDNKLEITASDQELTLRTSVYLDSSSQDGSMAVPARQIMDLLKSLPDQPIRIKTTGEGSFECAWNNGNSNFPYFPAADYPEIKSATAASQSFVFPAAALAEGISYTIYATADDEMRPSMNGIFFDISPESTTLVASDSHKLICYTSNEVKSDIQASFILHKKPAAVLRSIIDKSTEDVNIVFDNNTVVFNFGENMMVCRLIVGNYPRYREVIPQNNSNVLRVDRVQLLNTVRRVSVCANKASNFIKFDLKEGQLELSAKDLGFALAAYEKIDCDYSGDELSVGFKSNFVAEILSNMSCETLVMKFADSRRAVILLPSEEDPESGKLCGIMMPLMVS